MANFCVTPEIRDAFAHGAPPADDLSLGIFGRREDFEFCWIVNGRLDTQDIQMIVKLDGVTFHAKLDTAAFRSRLAVDGHLTREGMMWFSAEKAHDIGGAEPGDGGGDDRLVDRFQVGSGFEQNDGGQFGLIDAKPIAVESGGDDKRLVLLHPRR